ncbi:MAG TPA: hypothetical protein ENI23_17740 [bacterium]|nr:hypothetical protein [bacterium]
MKIKIVDKKVDENILFEYILYLFIGCENLGYSDGVRTRLHNAIFLNAGFKDKDPWERRARIIYHENEFDNELDNFICRVFCCPHGHGSLDAGYKCSDCGYLLDEKKLKYNFRNVIKKNNEEFDDGK